jgi:hypothetical protein
MASPASSSSKRPLSSDKRLLKELPVQPSVRREQSGPRRKRERIQSGEMIA